MERRAKIVATLGPATAEESVLAQLLKAGADVLRLNMSHGDHESHRSNIALVRRVAAQLGKQVPLLLDLMGPRFRLGTLAEPRTLRRGERITLGEAAHAVDLPVDDPGFLRHLREGERVLIADGLVELEVLAKRARKVTARVLSAGTVSTRKGINLPDTRIPFSVSAKDRADIAFAIAEGADWLGASYIGRARDVETLREVVREAGHEIPIVAKLERAAAVDHIDEIVAAADAVMVARGDLGVEMAPEDVPAIQKQIIAAGRKSGKPVVVATQMLDSMVHSPAPTRAEASDVATAVYDGADAVMLSAESASGQYPVEAVAMMDRIITRVERDPAYRRILDAQHPDPQATGNDAISAAAAQVAHTLSVAAIVTYTTSGSTVLRVARERPEVPILTLTASMATARALSMAWGAHCVKTADVKRFSEMVDKACRIALQQEIAKVGDRLVITAGVPFGTPGSTNILRVAWVEE